MSIDSKHPLWAEAFEMWLTMRHFYAGQTAVKEAGERYLPATSGMRIDGMLPKETGYLDYQAYKKRAVVPDYVEEAIEILVGLLHQKEPTVTLPPEMKPLIDNCTINGESLVTLLRRINVQQLITGRVALLADLSETPVSPDKAALPYIALYHGESVINWDDNSETDGYNALNMVVINESRMVRVNAFEWQWQNRYRVLQLGADIGVEKADGTANYMCGVFTNLVPSTESGAGGANGLSYVASAMTTPVYKGKPLTYIPFAFINSKDILAKPDKPPLYGLQQLCEAIYLLEADYRQNLHMQAQETLVVIGGVRTSGIPGQDDVLRTGAGSRIDVDQGGDAKYIGVSSLGLSEQRLAIQNDKSRASIKAGELIQSGSSQQESGEALQTRFTAQTATLNQIALTGAKGLENVLKSIAEWIGADPTLVEVVPNTEFVDFGLDGLNFYQIMQAKQLGMPISLESIHMVMADRGMTNMNFTEEEAAIKKEQAFMKILVPPPPAPIINHVAAPADPAKPADPAAKPAPTKPAAPAATK